MPRKVRNQEISELEKVRNWRHAIRSHRNEVGHNRCWMNDWLIYEIILGIPIPQKFPSFEECMRLCEQYWDKRGQQGDQPPTVLSRINKVGNVDLDLVGMSELQLTRTSEIISTAVEKHRKIGDGERTALDDRELYAVLPEKFIPNQTLPSRKEFVEIVCRQHIASCLKQ